MNTGITIIYNDGINQNVSAKYYQMVKDNIKKFNIFNVLFSKEDLKKTAENSVKSNDYESLDIIINILKSI